MVRTNQGGSILSFVVLGGIMALLLVGGAYVVRHNLAPAQKTPQVAVSDKSDESSDQNSDNDQAAPVQKDDQSENANTPDKSATSDNTNGNGSTKSKETPVPAPGSDSQSSGKLPTTGPPSLVLGGIMLSGFVAVAIAYLQSRRLRASL